MTSLHLKAIQDYIKKLPLTPGVYLIKNAQMEFIYIGKARELRKRLLSHFRQRPGDFKESLIQRDARHIEIIETASEAEALLLEASLIKEKRPKYNQELKDDKSYPFLKITMNETYPRLLVQRGRKSDGSLYFGPYTSAHLLKQAVALLRRLFPMRTCNPFPKRVCLMYHIGQCGGPCEGHMDKEAYGAIVKELIQFLNGKKDALLRSLSKRMKEASKEHKYEEAKVYRDQMQALSTVSVIRSPLRRLAVLNEMRQIFHLSKYPEVIEAFDISNFSGKNPVGSMVVFEEGAPRRSHYRKFKIKHVEGIDDYRMMKEIVRRRYERLLNEKKRLPDLILIDGGKGHLAAAQEELEALNLGDLDLMSIAKQHEHLFKPGRPIPFVLPQNSPVLQLLRHVRDEAHRFAITFYRRMHKKEMKFSELDVIPGVGLKRKKLLIKKLRHVSTIRGASFKELLQIKGIDKKTAKNIEDYFKKS